MTRPTRALPVVLLLCALSVVAAAQAPVVVPVEREPHHRPVFANAVVAVLDVRFPPGVVSQYHTHSNDNVSVRIETARTRIDLLGGDSTEQNALVGRVVFNGATPPYTHRVANLGESLVRIIDVEILAKAGLPPNAFAPDELAGHQVVVDNDRVRISRIVLEPSQHLTVHTHPRGWLTVMVRGWPGPGEFTWHDPGAVARPIEAGPTGTERVEIEVK